MKMRWKLDSREAKGGRQSDERELRNQPYAKTAERSPEVCCDAGDSGENPIHS